MPGAHEHLAEISLDLRPPRLVFPLLLLATLAVSRLAAAGAVETTLDNDTDFLVPGASTTDRNYTQGSRIAWHGGEESLPIWADRLALRMAGGDAAAQRRVGIAVGQEIYTPDAISRTRPVSNDRPYAGWLYGSAFMVTSDATRERSLEMRAGLVGPHSYAQQAQEWWHRETGVRAPRGWSHQLADEPGVMLLAQQRWRPWGRQRHVDLVPHASVTLGNVATYAASGATLRLGLPLPDDFGPSATNAPHAMHVGARPPRVQAFVFARAEGRAVAHNIVLDGNSSGSGPSVTRRPFVGEAQVGAGLKLGLLALRYAFSYTTHEFVERSDAHRYGSFSIGL